MDTQLPWPGESGSNTGRLVGATSNTEILGTKQVRRYKFVHRDAANAATKHMTQDEHLKIVRKTGSSKNKKQQAVGCDYIHIEANSSELIVLLTSSVRRELHNEFITAHNGKASWSTNAFVHPVPEIKHHDVFSSGNMTDEFPDKHPGEWT